MPWLRTVARKAGNPPDEFPFTVPAIRELERLDCDQAVTCLVGENGSGKSTMLEAIALAARLPAVGAVELTGDATLAAQRRLAGALKLTWSRRTHRGFFLRAEDFFGFVKRLQRERAELEQRLGEIETEYRAQDRSALGLSKAKMPFLSALGDMTRRYGEDLDRNSHGESFLALFRSRFVPGGLYLLDEPEAALSPQSQLGLVAMMLDAVKQEAQFIVATHSPIVLAYPRARIYDFDAAPVREARYDDLAHVRLMKGFLEDPAAYLRRLTE